MMLARSQIVSTRFHIATTLEGYEDPERGRAGGEEKVTVQLRPFLVPSLLRFSPLLLACQSNSSWSRWFFMTPLLREEPLRSMKKNAAQRVIHSLRKSHSYGFPARSRRSCMSWCRLCFALYPTSNAQQRCQRVLSCGGVGRGVKTYLAFLVLTSSARTIF